MPFISFFSKCFSLPWAGVLQFVMLSIQEFVQKVFEVKKQKCLLILLDFKWLLRDARVVHVVHQLFNAPICLCPNGVVNVADRECFCHIDVGCPHGWEYAYIRIDTLDDISHTWEWGHDYFIRLGSLAHV